MKKANGGILLKLAFFIQNMSSIKKLIKLACLFEEQK